MESPSGKLLAEKNFFHNYLYNNATKKPNIESNLKVERIYHFTKNFLILFSCLEDNEFCVFDNVVL